MATLIILLFVIQTCYSFNVDISRPYHVYTGDGGSYFGFSLLFHQHKVTKWLLVGAPRANSTFPDQSSLHSPGAVYQCDLHNITSSCKQATFDTRGNEEDHVTPYHKFTGMKDGQLMGATLAKDEDNRHVVASGHLWHNSYHIDAGHNKDYYFINGAVYQQNASLDQHPALTQRPLLNYSKQFHFPENGTTGLFYYSHAMAGFSMHYLQDGTLLLGSPGVMHFAGGVYHHSGGSGGGESRMVTPDVPGDSYLGYSLSSGRFFHGGTEWVVAGAPRYYNVGKVFLYDAASGGVSASVEGDQLAGYFGAVVLVGDWDSDGRDDLLVAAPYYNTSRGDEGKVIVYTYDDVQHGLVEQLSLYGSHAHGARFGSAMAQAGDINLDKYKDVLISAPYEDEGLGAVYIYHGSINGILPTYTQRITAAAMGIPSAFSFGFSIAGDFDVDDNNYPDVAVGCYGSDSVAVFLSSPVLNVQAVIASTRYQINPASQACSNQGPCLTFTVEFTYTGDYVPNPIDVWYSLHVDTHKTSAGIPSRASMRQDGNKQWKKHIDGTVTLYRGQTTTAETVSLMFSALPSDVFTPIRVELKHGLIINETSYPQHVLNTHLPNITYREFEFLKDCGEDDVCTSALELKVETAKQIILGSADNTLIDIHVENKGEPAFQAEVFIHHPHHMTYRRSSAITSRHLTCLPTDPEEGGTRELQPAQALLVCEIGHPLPANSVSHFTVELSSGNLLPSTRNIIINVTAVTTSSDARENHKQELNIPVIIDTVLFLSGGSVPEQASVTSGQLVRLMHLFDVVSSGPGLLPHATLQVLVPYIEGAQVTVILKHQHDDVQQHCSSVPSPHEGNSGGGHSGGGGRGGGGRGQQEGIIDEVINKLLQQPKSISQYLNCDTSPCLPYTCHVTSLQPRHNVLVTVTYTLNITLQEHISVYEVESEAFLLHGEGVPFLRSHRVSTHLYPPSSPDTPGSIPLPPWWVILISATMGIILFVATSFILWKCGFFRRSTREDLAELLAQRDEDEDEDHDDSIYEHIPEHGGGFVELHPQTRGAGFVPIREQTSLEASTTAEPNDYTDGSSHSYPAVEGYECPIPSTSDGINYLGANNNESSPFLPPLDEQYLTTNTMTRNPKAPLPKVPTGQEGGKGGMGEVEKGASWKGGVDKGASWKSKGEAEKGSKGKGGWNKGRKK